MTELQDKKVLIVDDEVYFRRQLRVLLVDTVYKVVGEATNGLDAVEKCRKFKPDVVLLDIKMPSLDGISTAQILVEEGLTKCVVMLTSFDDKKYVEEAIKVGASGYLVKPVEKKSTLVLTMDICLEKSKEYYLLDKDMKKLKHKQSTSDIVSQAKLIVMEKKGITEAKAYDFIRELSKKKQVSIEHISKGIVARYNKDDDL